MKTQPKNNNKPAGPDIDSILSGLSLNPEMKNAEDPQYSTPRPREASEISGRLWDEFIAVLNDPEDEADPVRSKKLYAIDEDIVETLHQCDFGKPNVQVINSILRTFLIDNIERLRDMHRPRSVSLLDKY